MNIFSKCQEGKIKMSMPNVYRRFYNDLTLRHRSGYTTKFLQTIIDDPMTLKNFYSIGEGMKSLRVEEYLRKKKHFT